MKTRILLVVLTWSIVAACTPLTTPPTGSATEAGASASPAINEQTRGELQALLQKQVSALSGHDQNGYLATFDPDRGALRRCANEAFDVASRQGVGAPNQIAKIDAWGSYVRAWVQESSGLRRIFFKKIDGKWEQSEPKEEELGGEKKITTQDVEINYWAIDQDVIDGLTKVTLSAKDIVIANLLSDSRRDALVVRFYPTRASAGIVGCTVAGYHVTNSLIDPSIRVVRYWLDASGQAAPFTLALITHEWLHWAQDQFSPGITARLPFWLTEGWPDYVGQARTPATEKFVMCQTTTPTLKQLEDGPDPNGPAELQAQWYSFYNLMVEYLYATYGGKDAYRNLLVAFKEDAVPANVFPKVLKVSAQQYYDDWKAWAKKKLC